MIRFLLALFGKSYEAYEKCKTCEALREQLEYERDQNKEMLNTLTSLLKPIPIIQPGTPEPRPVSPIGVTWTRRRAELEKQDRENARILKSSPVIAKPDSEVKPEEIKPAEPSTQKTIDQLELELGVTETEGVH